MKCPKCGYQSFNHLAACKKCGRNLADLQEKLGFDQARFQESAVPGRQSETEPQPNDTVRDDPALEGSLQNFFQSLEEPSDDTVLADEDDPFAATAPPPVDQLEPEDSPFGPANDAFDFEEDADDEDLLFSFDEMEGGLGEEQSPMQEDEQEETGDEPFVLSDSQLEEDEPELKHATEDFSAAAPGTEAEESSEEADFFSFADLDAELEDVEEPDQDLILGGETAETLTEESFANGFVSPQEIEKVMAEDAVSKARADSPVPLRTELEQGNFPFADGMQQEVSFREEAESPPRSVLGLRILAILSDAGILSVIFAAFLLAGEMVRLPDRADWFRFTPEAILDLAAPYFLVLFTLCFAYFTLFHFLTGQTPGKMLWRVRVEGEAGTPLSLAQAFLRTAGGLLALLPAGLGFLSIVVNRQRRGWNDRLANSRVVMAGPERP